MSKVNTKIFGNSYQYFNKNGSGLIYYPCGSSAISQHSQVFLEKNKKKAVTRFEVTNTDKSHTEFFIKSFGIFGYLTKILVFTAIHSYQEFKHIGYNYQLFDRSLN